LNSEDRKREIWLLQIASLLKEMHLVPREKVRLETRLSADLGMEGDDAREFMEEFFHRFSVNRGDFRTDEHFGPEAGWSPLFFLLRRRGLRDVRVSQLVEAIRRGRWDAAVDEIRQQQSGAKSGTGTRTQIENTQEQ